MRDVKVFGKIKEDLQIESVTQTYYEDNITGMSLHISGRTEEVDELHREIQKIVDRISVVSSLRKLNATD